MRRALALRLAAFALVFAAAVSAPVDAQTQDWVFPGAEWDYARGQDLTDLGWDGQKLRAVFEHLRDESNSTGVVVVDRGRVVFTFGDVQELSYLASVRKSVLSMLYGYWVENGTIDLEATLEELGEDDIGGLLPIERKARILDLITARSGVYHPASNGGDNLADAPERGSQEPGTYMLYNNWDFNEAGAIFEKLTGRSIYDEVQAQLAVPLQFEDWDRSAQRKSGNLTISKNPAYHMWISTRDMARIGYLMLHKGRWDGRQLISSDWVERITSVVTPLEEMHPLRRRDGYFGYGYMWWLWDGPRAVGPFDGAYTARGAIGQWITVFPAIDLVIAHKTNSVYRRTTSWESWQRMIELLFDARGYTVEEWPWG
jgi:CubicO group peptidase (beta-lactamase class C family)